MTGEREQSLGNIGLHELTGEETAAVVAFVGTYGDSEQQELVRREWQALPRDYPDVTQAMVADLAAGNGYLKAFACQLVPYLAEQDADVGFSFWKELANDDDQEVRYAASDALVTHLGRLSLHPKSVAGLVQTIFQAEREHGG